ncbi:hypothetical protein PENPOL_c002G10800 [Penicillium polonicum]|uniref:Uncharacterized protein n=1 Tax=Penicillium polonicum TaxID=60169 RepID=A0A1V6NWY4_PENPO|nr:hypothetical protein PENPOL_c002G10800 [Penicillium polonicum]
MPLGIPSRRELRDFGVNTDPFRVSDTFDKDKDLRLATLVSVRNDVFLYDIAHYGYTYTFRPKPEETDGSVDDRKERRNNPTDTENPQNIMKSRKSWEPTRNTSVEGLHDILHVSELVEPSIRFGILSWIDGGYSNSRGFEIGTFNHSLLST